MQSAGGPSKKAYSIERAGGRAALFSKKLLRQQHELKRTKCHFGTEDATVEQRETTCQTTPGAPRSSEQLPDGQTFLTILVSQQPHDVSWMGKLEQHFQLSETF